MDRYAIYIAAIILIGILQPLSYAAESESPSGSRPFLLPNSDACTITESQDGTTSRCSSYKLGNYLDSFHLRLWDQKPAPEGYPRLLNPDQKFGDDKLSKPLDNGASKNKNKKQEQTPNKKRNRSQMTPAQ